MTITTVEPHHDPDPIPVPAPTVPPVHAPPVNPPVPTPVPAPATAEPILIASELQPFIPPSDLRPYPKVSVDRVSTGQRELLVGQKFLLAHLRKTKSKKPLETVQKRDLLQLTIL